MWGINKVAIDLSQEKDSFDLKVISKNIDRLFKKGYAYLVKYHCEYISYPVCGTIGYLPIKDQKHFDKRRYDSLNRRELHEGCIFARCDQHPHVVKNVDKIWRIDLSKNEFLEKIKSNENEQARACKDQTISSPSP